MVSDIHNLIWWFVNVDWLRLFENPERLDGLPVI